MAQNMARVGLPLRGTMLQGFEWYLPNDSKHWNRLRKRAGEFADARVTSVWIPPPYKGWGGVNGTGATTVGYDVYDLYDLGEFNARKSVATKYGTKAELEGAVSALRAVGVDVYVDVVLNHRAGAEEKETLWATPYNKDFRDNPIGPRREIDAYCKFAYAERGGKYSQFEWNRHSFDAVDHDARNPNEKNVIWLFDGKRFDQYVSLERANYDYLLGCDVDFENMYVREELTRWGEWMVNPATFGGCQGFRLDAVKHITSKFWPDFLRAVRQAAKPHMKPGRDFFVVGEYVEFEDLNTLNWFLGDVGEENAMHLFDFPLLNKFSSYSRDGNGSNMSEIFKGTLVEQRPDRAVTFVTNHDTVPGQDLERHVHDWFKLLAYALILLRREGYPTVFLADVDGSEYVDKHGNRQRLPRLKDHLYAMMKARQTATFGKQIDYFDDFHVIGWTFDGREGLSKPAKACAVVMSGGPAGSKRMDVGGDALEFRDVLHHQQGVVRSGGDNHAEFPCAGGSVSVWVEV